MDLWIPVLFLEFLPWCERGANFAGLKALEIPETPPNPQLEEASRNSETFHFVCEGLTQSCLRHTRNVWNRCEVKLKSCNRGNDIRSEGDLVICVNKTCYEIL